MINIKRGVNLKGLQPEIILALMAATEAYSAFNLDCTITSALDGEHMEGSKHYEGLAVDLRTHTLNSEHTKTHVIVAIRNALGDDYDVLLHAPDTINEHIHIEYDPKQVTETTNKEVNENDNIKE